MYYQATDHNTIIIMRLTQCLVRPTQQPISRAGQEAVLQEDRLTGTASAQMLASDPFAGQPMHGQHVAIFGDDHVPFALVAVPGSDFALEL